MTPRPPTPKDGRIFNLSLTRLTAPASPHTSSILCRILDIKRFRIYSSSGYKTEYPFENNIKSLAIFSIVVFPEEMDSFM